MKNNLKKKLYIITTSNIPSYLKKTNNDVLALSMGSIVSMSNLNINHKTIDDFVSRSQIIDVLSKFKIEFDDWIQKNDQILASKNFVKCFYPNAFWMMHRLTNYLYLVTLVKKIKKRYKSFHIITNVAPKKWQPFNKNYFNLRFSSSENSLVDTTNLIYSLLVNSTFEILKNNSGYKFYFKFSTSILNRSISIFLKRFNLYVKKIKFPTRYKLAILHDGYDVSFLYKKIKKYKFLNVKAIIFKNISKQSCFDHNFNNLIKKNSKPFFSKWFGKISNQLLNCYCSQISFCNYLTPSILKEAELILKKNNVKHLLCSIGIQDQIEYIISVVCRKLGIKIHSFKHSGIENLFFKDGILDSYLEKNYFPPRIQYLYSKVEKEKFKNIAGVDTKVVGRLETIDIKEVSRRNNKKILYCLGPENHTSFKEMDRMTYDNERYKFILELVKNCYINDLILDIKLHPKLKKDQYDYMLEILKNFKRHKFFIHTEGTVERILHNYELIIIDIAYTRLFTSLLYFKKDFILFLPKEIEIEEKHFLSLTKRVHIVREISELRSKIVQFKNKNLKKKNINSFENAYLHYPSTKTLETIKKEISI